MDVYAERVGSKTEGGRGRLSVRTLGEGGRGGGGALGGGRSCLETASWGVGFGVWGLGFGV